MSQESIYEYDVAFSFAGAQRDYVQRVRDSLKQYDISVFYDDDNSVELWGRNLYRFLDEIYSKKSRYCVMFISKEYKERLWTNHESQAAQERQFQENSDDFQEYILPVFFDDTQIPGVHSTTGYMDARKITPEELALCIANKLGKNRFDYCDISAIFNKLVSLLEEIVKQKMELTLEQENEYIQVGRKGKNCINPILSMRLLEQSIMIAPEGSVSGITAMIHIFFVKEKNNQIIKVINLSNCFIQCPEVTISIEELLYCLKEKFICILEESNDTIS